METLKNELLNDPEGLGYNLQDHLQIEQLINQVSRTKLVPLEVGKGDVLNSLGLEVGNALCDLIDNTSDFRHVKNLFASGRLRLDYPRTQEVLQSLIGITIGPDIVFAQEHINSLNAPCTRACSRAEELGLNYVTDKDIREALA